MLNNLEFPDMPLIQIKDFGRRPTTQGDITILCYLIKEYSKGNILEIGCWEGKTTYDLAVNFPDKIVYTLDYVEDDLILSNHGKKHQPLKEDICKYANDLENVKFNYKNAHTYNFSYFKNVDFIFIDGDHSFEGVKKDTEKSIDYLKKRNGGIIAWHDVKNSDTDVPKYLMQEIAPYHDLYFFNRTGIGYIQVKEY